MIHAILLFNHNGEVLISRTYKGQMARVDGLLFARNVVLSKELSDKPIRQLGSSYFIHIVYDNIIFVASTRENSNYTLIVRLLYRLADILRSYFQGRLTVNLIKRNFVLIYELLDEVLDFGYPQILDIDVLKRYITQSSGSKDDLNDQQTLSRITVQATGNTSWRAEGIRHRKNEVYIDVVEYVNVLMSQGSQVLHSDVTGQIRVKSLLSGMPECKFGMNDKLQLGGGDKAATLQQQASPSTSTMGQTNFGKYDQKRSDNLVALDDCKFHQCVRLSSLDRDHTITFIPPDGAFELMNYRTTSSINIPFKLFPNIQEIGNTRLDISLLVKANFLRSLIAFNVSISIPLPENTGSVHIISCSGGKAKFEASKQALIWRIKKLNGETEIGLHCEAELVRNVSAKRWSRPPISMNFRIPMYTSSGLCVRFLRVQEKSNYTPIKWIRYVTTSGNYQHRI